MKKKMVRKTEGPKHFIMKATQKRGTQGTGELKRPHQFHPGTVALRGDQKIPNVDRPPDKKTAIPMASQGDSPGDQSGYVPDPCYSFGNTGGS